MRKYLFIFLLYSVASGQIPNPCEDERFIKISEKFVDQMTDIEYQYFLKKQEECTEYENNAKVDNWVDDIHLKKLTNTFIDEGERVVQKCIYFPIPGTLKISE